MRHCSKKGCVAGEKGNDRVLGEKGKGAKGDLSSVEGWINLQELEIFSFSKGGLRRPPGKSSEHTREGGSLLSSEGGAQRKEGKNWCTLLGKNMDNWGEKKEKKRKVS